MLRARLDPRLGLITGTVQAGPGVGWTEALSLLPMPDDDLSARRTWPGRAERGSLRLEPVADAPGTWRFTAIIPRRYGAAGLVPGRGLFINGLWHPQPVEDGRTGAFDWDAQLELPPGVTGALNGTVGQDSLRWSGRADRLALAALPRARVHRQSTGAGELVVLETGRPRKVWESRLAQLLAEAWPLPQATQLVVVETPMYRRLYRAGPGQLFLSDHALRLTDGLWHLHAAAVRRAMLEATLPVQDTWARTIAADLIGEARKTERDPRDLLGWFAWLPQIDELLYDGNLPYYSELFDESHPGDPVEDDLLEILTPTGPAPAAARKIEARVGEPAALALAEALVAGQSLAEAGAAAGLPDGDLLAWETPCTHQDLKLSVRPVGEDGSYIIEVVRDAPADAPPELVVLEVDGHRLSWDTPPGPASHTWPWPVRPRRVVLDPDGVAHQTSASGDTWPARWGTIVSAWVYELDLSAWRAAGFADLTFRQQYNTRWLWGVSAETDARDLASFQVYALTYWGPLLDRRARPLRVGAAFGPSLLDPDYSSTEAGALVWDGAVWAAFDTRDDLLLPRHGVRLRASAGAGLSGASLSETGFAWRSAGLGGLVLAPLGGRLVLGARGATGAAESLLPHRQLGPGVAGVDPGVALGDRQLGGELELRWQAMRNRSVPFGVAWLSDVQLSGGLEAGWLRTETGPLQVAGWTAGVATVWDLLGARPTLMGVWFAMPEWGSPELTERRWPRTILRFEQSF